MPKSPLLLGQVPTVSEGYLFSFTNKRLQIYALVVGQASLIVLCHQDVTFLLLVRSEGLQFQGIFGKDNPLRQRDGIDLADYACYTHIQTINGVTVVNEAIPTLDVYVYSLSLHESMKFRYPTSSVA